MAAILDDHKLFYASVPKVACSSVKRMFYEIENGVAFDTIIANGRKFHAHHFYPGILRNKYPQARIADYRRLCLVRDPIKRFLSAYSNRVVFHGELTPQAVKAAGRFKRLTPNPELDEFIDRFEGYLAIPTIHSHCRPMSDYLGTQADYFSAVYNLSDMDRFVDDVSQVLDRPLTIGRFQTGGPKLDPSLLSAKQTEKLKRYYKSDYEAFGTYL